MSDNGRVDVDAIRAMLDAITPGEWTYNGYSHDHEVYKMLSETAMQFICYLPRDTDVNHADGKFIAAAPALVRSMAAEIVALREQVADQSAIIAGLGDVIAGRVKPISQLWDDIEADDAQP